VNSTETPGGSGIPAGWYDDPSGQGLRWWDGDAWTEHVHTAESAAAATAGAADGSREGAPPRDLVKLRESIRGRGSKSVGMVLGALVLVVVVVALLVSGGSESSSGAGNGGQHAGAATAKATRKALKAVEKQLKKGHLSKAEKKALRAEAKALKGNGSGKASKKQVEEAEAAARKALKQNHS
jgi:hypothetical protein